MADIIHVTTDRLRAAAGELESGGSRLDSCTRQMTELVSQIAGDVWSGEAASTYKARFLGLSEDMGRLVRMIREHVQDLNQIADNFDRTEAETQELAQSLQQNVIV